MIETTTQPGGTEGWHTHPGTLVEYLLQGPWTMERRGKPMATYQTGETFSIAEGEVHQAINNGKTTVRGLAIVIVNYELWPTTADVLKDEVYSASGSGREINPV